MRVGLVSTPVPVVPLSRIQRDYYFYLFASRVLSVFDHLGVDDFKRFWMLEPIHLGLLQLIAFLEEHGIECSYFGTIAPPGRPVDRESALLEKVLRRAGGLDVLGFSTITASYPTAVRMAAAVRRAFPDLPLVIGGAHAWACDEQILRDSPFDVVVRKEGELTTLELVRALEAGTPPDGIAGLSFRRDGKPVRNPDRPRMDRRVLPNPAYRHLEDNLDPADLAGERQISIPVARVTPTTGCTNHCVWCADFWKDVVSEQTLPRLAEEVDSLIAHRGCKYFYLGTHDYFHDLGQARAIALTMAKVRNDIRWEAQTRVAPDADTDLLRLLADCGCRCLHIGVESGHQGLLDAMGKNIDFAEARAMHERALAAGLHTHTYWLIGSPFETRETAAQTIRTMRQWLASGLSSGAEINLLVGYPGTRFYQETERYHITWQEPDFSRYDGRNWPTYETRELGRRDLEYLFQRAMVEYCEALAGRLGSRDEILGRLGERMPDFDPAVMEAVF
ncbi:MAG: B12-binding domain-containing radical SAM protein [Deltaproteobacteria bacterium]|nr:B12-binding domain-containing radical SAM protein [Deltaproteobacteria bacterium]